MADDRGADEPGPARRKNHSALKPHNLRIPRHLRRALSSEFGQTAVDRQKILTIAAFGGFLCEFVELIKRDITAPQGDLLGVGDSQACRCSRIWTKWLASISDECVSVSSQDGGRGAILAIEPRALRVLITDWQKVGEWQRKMSN
jgi:hypothetical protein